MADAHKTVAVIVYGDTAEERREQCLKIIADVIDRHFRHHEAHSLLVGNQVLVADTDAQEISDSVHRELNDNALVTSDALNKPNHFKAAIVGAILGASLGRAGAGVMDRRDMPELIFEAVDGFLRIAV
jgi:hypothetical protein